MGGVFFQARGISPKADVRVVFVWCRNKGPDDYVLLGSALVVRADGNSLPNGISPGQFNVTFLLPPGLSPANIVVTDDTIGKEFLAGVTVMPCSGLAPPWPRTANPPDASAIRANGAAPSSQDSKAIADYSESDA